MHNKCSLHQYFLFSLFVCFKESKHIDNHSMDTGECWSCWTSHFKRGAEVKSSPKINISAQHLKKGPAQDSRGTITRERNISAQKKKIIFLHKSQTKAIFWHNWIRNSLNLHCFASFFHGLISYQAVAKLIINSVTWQRDPHV